MEMLYKDSDKVTPVIFVLSQGADPSLQLIKFADQMNMGNRFRSISLGQGQNHIAEELIKVGK